jgi:hypothetical protein
MNDGETGLAVLEADIAGLMEQLQPHPTVRWAAEQAAALVAQFRASGLKVGNGYE